MVKGKQYKCGGGGGGGGGKTIEMWWRWWWWWWRKTIEMWWRWWWWRERNRNVAMVVYSFTIYEAVLKKKLRVGSMWDPCGVDVGSMWGRRGRGWKICIIKRGGVGKIIKLRKNIKTVEEGIKN